MRHIRRAQFSPGKDYAMQEKKSTYKGNTDAHRAGNARYLAEKVEDIKLRVPKGQKDYYKTAASAAGQSLNQFAISAMDEKISREHLMKRK